MGTCAKDVDIDIQKLYRAQSAQLANYLNRHYLKDQPLADELAQEAFMSLYAVMCQGKQILDPKGYLFRTGANFALMYLRHARFESRFTRKDVGEEVGQIQDNAALPEHVAVSAELVALATEGLNPRQRAVLALVCVQERPRREVATILGITEGRLDKCVTKVLKQCRKRLTAAGIDMPVATRKKAS